MKEEIKSILKQVLAKVQYKGDVDKFCDSFIEDCHVEALAVLVESLPENEQAEVMSKLKNSSQNNLTQAEIEKYFPPDEYKNVFSETLKNAFNDYLEEITPDLTEEQDKELEALFQTMQSSSPGV